MDIPRLRPYANYQLKRAEFKEDNDCCVCSISHACGVPYRVAHAACKKAGRKNRKGMYDSEIAKAVSILGFKLIKVKCKSKTVRTLYRNIKSNKSFLVFINDHLSSIVNKETWDENIKNKCSRIEQVYLVEKFERNSPTFLRRAK